MQKILVIQTAFLGDALLAIPLLRSLRNQYPTYELHLLCRKGFAEFFEKMKLVDRAWEVNKKDSQNRKSVLSELKKIDFEILFSPHESVRTALWVSQLKAKKKIGFKKWWNFLIFHERILKNKKLPDALRQLSILGSTNTGIKEKIKTYFGGVPEWASMSLEKEMQRNPHIVRWEIKKPAVFIAPGSIWATKRWMIDGYKKVAEHYAKTHSIVFVGAADEREICENLKNHISESINLAGQTSILDLLFLFQKGTLLVCNDSGAMHVASAAGLPTTAIFGPTVLDLGYQPWQKKAVVVEKQMSCRPCGKHGHQKCPIGTHACMKDITPQEVIEKGTALLSSMRSV